MACSGKLKLFRKDVLLSALEEGSEDPKEELEHNHGILRALETTASREETESGEDEISDDERERLFRRTKSNVDGHERRGSARRRLCAIFFLNSFGFSIYLPYFVLFVKEKVGLSAGQVGIIAALEIVGGYAVSPLVSLFVDRYRRHRLVWLTSIISCIVPIESVPLAKTFGAALGLALVTAVLKAPSGSILNAYTLALLGKDSKDYGKVRLWGAIGWGLGSLLGGFLVQAFGTPVAFVVSGTCLLSEAGLVFSLDFAVLKMDERSPEENANESFLKSAALLIPDCGYLFFLFVSIVAGFGATGLQSLMLIFLSDLGAPDVLAGIALSVATLSELPIFWFSGAMISEFGAPSLLCASMAAFTVRSILVSFLVNPWLVLPLQLLHGFTFAGAWTAGVALAKQNSPVGLETSGQSVFSLAYNGIGGLTGSIVGGQLYDLIGARNMYRVKALVFAVTAAVYFFTFSGCKSLTGRLSRARTAPGG